MNRRAVLEHNDDAFGALFGERRGSGGEEPGEALVLSARDGRLVVCVVKDGLLHLHERPLSGKPTVENRGPSLGAPLSVDNVLANAQLTIDAGGCSVGDAPGNRAEAYAALPFLEAPAVTQLRDWLLERHR